jgi:N-acetylglutamate synthase-like GNAT family acetyltransferase
VQTYEDLLNRSGIKQLPLYLFTDDAVEFYEKLGFKPQAIGLGKVVGQWLGGDA